MYDSSEETFLVHCKVAGLPNLLFKEHRNGLNFFDLRQADFAFVKTVESNMRLYSKQQVTRVDKACSLYASLGFPSQKDFIWTPVRVEDAMVAYKNLETKCGRPEREDSPEEAGAHQN